MQSKRITKALSFVLSLCFLCCALFGSSVTAQPTTVAYASSKTDRLKSKKQKIQNEINETQKKLDKLKQEKSKQEDYVTELDKKIQLLQDQIDTLQSDADDLQSEIDKTEDKISQIESEIQKTQKEIDKKQKELDKSFDEYCQRLRAMYVSGRASNLEVLLECDDISSILTRSQMIKSVSKEDSDILNRIMEKIKSIEQDKADLEKKNVELKESKDKIVKSKKALTDSINQISSSKKELDAEVAECNAAIRELSKKSTQYMESIDENREAAAAVERDIQAAYASASNASHGTGSIGGSSGNGSHSGALGYPTSYRTISAGYPNYSSGRYHGGIDFPCPKGTTVRAAASGTVIVAKNLNYSYGHYLIIDHGNGLSTLYAHNTTLVVGVGDKVSKGQTIAYSGSTGNSTGPHCHFEVRVNGTRVNPNNYL